MELQPIRLLMRVVSTQINLSTPKFHPGSVVHRSLNVMLVGANIATQRGVAPNSRITFLKKAIPICIKAIQDLKVL